MASPGNSSPALRARCSTPRARSRISISPAFACGAPRSRRSCSCAAERSATIPRANAKPSRRSGAGAFATTEDIMGSPLSIYVLVDALGWELIKSRPFLDDLMIERRWLVTILGYSSGAIPSILAGSYPSEHGHWNLFYHSPETSPFAWTRGLKRLPAQVRESRVARRAVKYLSRRMSGYSGYFSIYSYPIANLPMFDLTEKRDIYTPGGLDRPSIFDTFRDAEIPYECYTYHTHSDAQILDVARERVVSSDARVLFLYLSNLDHYLHWNIHDADGVTAKLAWYEHGLRRIYEAATRERGDARM